MNRIIATLLLTAVCSLSVGVAYSTDAPAGRTRLAALSALDPAARPKTPRRAPPTDLQSPQSRLRAAIPDQSANPRNTAAPAKEPLDLRPPDLRSIQGQLAPEATLPADADDTQVVAIVGAPSPPEESSNTHLSRTGIGSIYWAARHSAQAWAVLLPIVAGDGSVASEDIRARCATFVRQPGGQATCP